MLAEAIAQQLRSNLSEADLKVFIVSLQSFFLEGERFHTLDVVSVESMIL